MHETAHGTQNAMGKATLSSEKAWKENRSGNDDDYEEEIRLLYVAATRARSQMEIITANTRNNKN